MWDIFKWDCCILALVFYSYNWYVIGSIIENLATEVMKDVCMKKVLKRVKCPQKPADTRFYSSYIIPSEHRGVLYELVHHALLLAQVTQWVPMEFKP